MSGDGDGVSSLSSSTRVARSSMDRNHGWPAGTTREQRAAMAVALDESVNPVLDQKIVPASEVHRLYADEKRAAKPPSITGPHQSPPLTTHPGRRKYPIPADGPARQKDYGDWVRKQGPAALKEATKSYPVEKIRAKARGQVTVIRNPDLP